MLFFFRWGIARRLYVLSFVLIAALAVVANAAWVRLTSVHALSLQAGTDDLSGLERLAEFELTLTRLSLHVRQSGALNSAIALAEREDLNHRVDRTLQAIQRDTIDAGSRPFAQTLLPLMQGLQTSNAGDVSGNPVPMPFDRVLALVAAEKARRRLSLVRALTEVGIQARDARTQVSVMVVAVAFGLLGFSWYIVRLLRRRVALAQRVAERVRQGDLTRSVVDNTHDEFHPLLLTLGSMQLALMNVVSNVREGAERVAAASVQIAQGNDDLSQRTDRQAEAIEETAASMAQLDTAVRNNAGGALQARQLAQNALGAAHQAGDVMGRVVETMRGINDSAQSIEGIISVIDGIAFQTNILALNAAVEAARAGVQGRGFAVVAEEVRNLARRSSVAAHDIKRLIASSVDRAGQGRVMADEAGTAMQAVVHAIGRVSRIMEDISAASQQQSSDLSRVSGTVTQVDQATQHNAALVEQIAAAASSLKIQAHALVQGVAVFTLEPVGACNLWACADGSRLA